MSKDCWADADERDAMIAEGDRLRHVLAAVERERDDARLREDSVHVFAKRLLGDGPNTMEIIRRAAVRHEELVRAARGLLLTYLRPADPMWCGCCAMYMDVPGHKSDCAAAALVRALNGDPQGGAPTAPPDPVPEIERLKAENASLRDEAKAANTLRLLNAEMLKSAEADLAAAEHRAEAAEKRATELMTRLRRIRYVAGHKSTTPNSDYVRIYEEATAALPAGDLLSFPEAVEAEGQEAATARAALHDEERSAPQQQEEILRDALAVAEKKLEDGKPYAEAYGYLSQGVRSALLQTSNKSVRAHSAECAELPADSGCICTSA